MIYLQASLVACEKQLTIWVAREVISDQKSRSLNGELMSCYGPLAWRF